MEKETIVFDGVDIETTDDLFNKWSVWGWCDKDHKTTITKEIATINLKGEINWNKEFENTKDKLILHNIKQFFQTHFFSESENLEEQLKDIFRTDDYIEFKIYNTDGDCEYGVEMNHILGSRYWAFGLYSTDSAQITPYATDPVTLLDLVYAVLNDIETAVGDKPYCLEII